MKITFFIVSIFLSFSSLAQNSAVTEFKDTHGTALSLYFYPSTLRMVNIERNKEFDEMIREVKKARFFRMDSGAVSSADILELTNALREDGFEEIMTIKAKTVEEYISGCPADRQDALNRIRKITFNPLL